MIDLNSKSKESVSDHINGHIDNALTARPEKRRTYLGASSLGKACARSIQYEFLGTPKEKEFSGQTLRIFALGHILEEEAVKWFRQAGFDLRNAKPDGSQYGFETGGGKISGHVDGVICGGPDVGLTWPCLWEMKSANNTKFNAMVKHGVKKANPVYYAQVNLYMAYMDLADNPAVFTVINKNTSQLHHEIITFDGKVAQDTSDKAVRILQAGEQMLPRISDDPSYFQCNWCEFAQRCHYS